MDILTISWSTSVLLLIICLVSHGGADYQLTVLHTNDVHARIEQFNKYGSECSQEDAEDGACFGGVARRATKVKEIRNRVTNVLLLDGGDQYQANCISFFAHTQALGNHEFDNEPEGLRPFLLNTTFPVLSCNIDASAEPSINGLFQKRITRVLSGETIGIIGYTYFKTHEISSSGECIFHPEVQKIQEEVDALGKEGINKIIAVGHSGINIDLEIAQNVIGVDVVVGGHTDTFLYTGTPPSTEVPSGDYPLVVDQKGGGRALVVQDYTFGKYLGNLDVTFNDAGEVIAYGGNPVLLDYTVTEDQTILEEVEKWAGLVRNSSAMFVGISHAFLEGDRTMCRARECNLGNLIADAMVSQNNKNPDELRWNDVGIALMNGGSIRASISQGDITIGDIANVLPFGNTVDVLELRGIHLLEALENAISMYDLQTLDGRFLQFSGMRVTYSLARKPGSRVVLAEALCTNCTVPHYEPLDTKRVYKIVTNSFLAGGGDGYTVVRDNKMNHVTGNLDSAVFAEYIQRLSPVAPALEGRVTVLTDDVVDCTGNASNFGPSHLIISTTFLAIMSNILSTL
nr:snake venom 5'-nucleotidase-like [Lytechinus pictus]